MSASTQHATPLSNATLASLPPGVAGPTYDRDRVSVGIVHFGVGGFHRAHQAMYLDRLMSQGQALGWGICGVGIMPADQRMRDALRAQDCLYTLVVKNPDGTIAPTVIGSIIEYLFAPDDPDAVIERMADPKVQIVSLTITEGGYNFNAISGKFDETNPDVVHDLRAGAAPKTSFGLITAALHRRRQRGVTPFTIMSCDNIPGNGDAARRSFTAFATLSSPDLGAFLKEKVRFPNSMVDRITPVTTDEDRAEVKERFGIEDRWPVVCEPFAQWVIEDSFAGERPPFEEVGVQVVADVEPYELLKLRLLNASHQALCYFGYLAGYRLVHEVCQNPLFARFLRSYMDREATPTLPPVPGIDLDQYKQNLVERFASAAVRDTVARLCAETSDRIPKFLLPVIREQLRRGGPITLSAAVVASWARYAEGVDEQGEPIEIVDRLKDSLIANARRQREDPFAFISNRDVFGDLVDDERFRMAYTSALDALHSKGARATLEGLVGDGRSTPESGKGVDA